MGPSKQEMDRFFVAASTGKDGQVERFLDAGGIDVDAWGSAGQHALYKAVLSKSQATLRVLLKHGANPNRLTEPGYAAIHEAAHSGQADMICDLFTAGADVNLMSGSGAYAISYACAQGHIDAALALATRGATLQVLHSKAGESVLHQVSGVASEDSALVVLANLAIDAGVSLNAYSERGFTPLHKAVEAKNVRMLLFLLESGADPLLKGLEPKDAEGSRWHVGKSAEEFASSIRSDSCEAVLRSWSAKRAARSAIDELCIGTVMASGPKT